MPRKRAPGNEGLPPGLYLRADRGVYYTRLHGVRREHGRNLSHALEQHQRVVDALKGLDPRTLAAALDAYLERARKTLAASTVAERERMAEVFRRRLGTQHLVAIKARHWNRIWEQMPGHAAKSHRSMMVQVYRVAISNGVVDDNEAERSLVPITPARRRVRLYEADYDRIHAIAPEWFQISMAIALTTLLRRGDLWRATRDDVRPYRAERWAADGWLWPLRHDKTGKRVNILAPPGSRLCVALTAARAHPIGAPWLLSDRAKRSQKTVLTRTFRRLADRVGCESTWHELKSLGKRLYDERCGTGVATALAQWDEATEVIYEDQARAEVVEAAL